MHILPLELRSRGITSLDSGAERTGCLCCIEAMIPPISCNRIVLMEILSQPAELQPGNHDVIKLANQIRLHHSILWYLEYVLVFNHNLAQDGVVYQTHWPLPDLCEDLLLELFTALSVELKFP